MTLSGACKSWTALTCYGAEGNETHLHSDLCQVVLEDLALYVDEADQSGMLATVWDGDSIENSKTPRACYCICMVYSFRLLAFHPCKIRSVLAENEQKHLHNDTHTHAHTHTHPHKHDLRLLSRTQRVNDGPTEQPSWCNSHIHSSCVWLRSLTWAFLPANLVISFLLTLAFRRPLLHLSSLQCSCSMLFHGVLWIWHETSRYMSEFEEVYQTLTSTKTSISIDS